jgi:choline dehydrogenase-like flavoprotein
MRYGGGVRRFRPWTNDLLPGSSAGSTLVPPSLNTSMRLTLRKFPESAAALPALKGYVPPQPLNTAMHCSPSYVLADDPGAVVDSLGKVRGVAGLRVVDASIFPEIPSVATNLTTIMVAEYIAARIRG